MNALPHQGASATSIFSLSTQNSMEQMKVPEEHVVALGESSATTHQSILTDVLKIAMGASSVKRKMGEIVEYLLRLEQFQFGNRAAVFVIDQSSEKLIQLWSKGFGDGDNIPCRETRVGLCHCGRTAQSGEITFFTTPPPQLNISKDPEPFQGNYCVPIMKDWQALGVLTIYVTGRHRHTKAIELLFDAISNILAVIIENQQMDQQLVQLVNDLRGTIINLREEKKFSESIIQGLNHGLIVVDLDGRIRKSNHVARQIFKPFSRDLDGQFLADILGENGARRLQTTDISQQSGDTEKELSLISPGGEKKIIGFTNVCREDARGVKVGVIISLSDISELKYVRKEMEKMNRLSTVAEIASAVAHEVRNPLAGIKIMAQSIEEETRDNSEQLECAQRIIRQVDRLNQLLSDFFSYARPAEPNKRPTSLSSIVAETKPLINNRLMKNHIEVVEDISASLPMIIADPHQVQQVFLNLFLNAIDAIKEQGRIDIQASTLTRGRLLSYKKKYPALLKNAGYVVVHFTDNGAGMSPTISEQVFEPFFTTKTSGAGLGLSIVYRTLKENDAAIVLQSKEGKGTTFTIFFRTDM